MNMYDTPEEDLRYIDGFNNALLAVIQALKTGIKPELDDWGIPEIWKRSPVPENLKEIQDILEQRKSHG